jgi:hypothetical protein
MTTTASPASKTAAEASKETPARKRIPLSIPTRKMEVDEIPGFHLYWFLESNVPRALQGGYEFVDSDEVPLHQRGVATDSTISGNADLGSHIKLVAGIGDGGRAEYQILMKIREEWYLEDQKVIEARNAAILAAIFRKEYIAGSDKVSSEDQGLRYVKTALFQRPTRKGD